MSNNSIGEINLELKIVSDINKQVNTISNMIGKNLKTSLNAGIKGAFSNMNSSIKTSVSSIGKILIT